MLEKLPAGLLAGLLASLVSVTPLPIALPKLVLIGLTAPMLLLDTGLLKLWKLLPVMLLLLLLPLLLLLLLLLLPTPTSAAAAAPPDRGAYCGPGPQVEPLQCDIKTSLLMLPVRAIFSSSRSASASSTTFGSI